MNISDRNFLYASEKVLDPLKTEFLMDVRKEISVLELTELVVSIFSFITIEELIQIKSVNKVFNENSQDDRLWEKFAFDQRIKVVTGQKIDKKIQSLCTFNFGRYNPFSQNFLTNKMLKREHYFAILENFPQSYIMIYNIKTGKFDYHYHMDNAIERISIGKFGTSMQALVKKNKVTLMCKNIRIIRIENRL